MVKSSITYISLLIALMVGITLPAVAQSDFDDILSGVLEGMHSSAADNRRNAQPDAALFAGVAEEMAITGTLDYLYDVYESPIPALDAAMSFNTGASISSMTSRSGSHVNDLRDFGHLVPPMVVTPVAGRITSRFGYRPQFGRMHHGTDIAVSIGDTIRAAAAGRVARVANDAHGYGIFICLKHDGGLETRYAHLSRCLVSEGMTVMAGQPIALGGNTGNSTGPHLHFETRVNGRAVDLSAMFGLGQRRGPQYGDFGNEYAYGVGASDAEAGDIKSATNRAGVSPGAATYVVRFGDTIESVARKHGMNAMKLCNLNMLSLTDQLQPGRMLKLR